MVVYWFANVPLAPGLYGNLLAAGLRQYSGSVVGLPADCFCIYASPHDFLEGWRRSQSGPPTASLMEESYQSLLACVSRHRLVASWRLECLSPRQIASWAVASHLPTVSSIDLEATANLLIYPAPPPLTAAVTVQLLNECPACLEAYFSLERLAERFGMAPDLDYLSRLDQSLNSADLLDHWWHAGDCDDFTLLQLQSLEEERLSLVLAHQRQSKIVATLRIQQLRLLRLIRRQSELLGRLGCP